MADKETVIKGLEECTGKGHCTECPYGKESQTLSCKKLLADVLSVVKEQEEEIEALKQTAQSMMEGVCLLKKQEAVEPIPPTDESDLWRCGNCNRQLFRCTHQRYCESCGKKVKWNESDDNA